MCLGDMFCGDGGDVMLKLRRPSMDEVGELANGFGRENAEASPSRTGRGSVEPAESPPVDDVVAKLCRVRASCEDVLEPA